MPKTNTIPFSRLNVDGDDLLDEADELDELAATGNTTLGPAASPSVEGEQDVGGDNMDPAADDDTLEMAHKMGIGLDADEEDPKELNIAQDVAEAEHDLS